VILEASKVLNTITKERKVVKMKVARVEEARIRVEEDIEEAITLAT